MKILLDECLPRKLKFELSGHEAYTVPQMGWASKKNGELLALMSEQFDVFLTVDSNMQHQQNLDNAKIAFVVLAAPNNRLDTLKAVIPQALETLKAIQSGQVVRISAAM